MPTRAIAFDLTRLIGRLRHASPSGIDRVDLAYARHVLGAEGPRFGLVSSPFGPRVLDRDDAVAIVEAVAAAWVEGVNADDDAVYCGLLTKLGEPPLAGAGHRSDGARRRRRIQAAAILRSLRARGAEALPVGTIYLHSSHLRLDWPRRFDWLYGRSDIRPIFFIHDLIPISHPEYGRSGEAGRHARRMQTVARHAAAVIVNSADVGARFSAHLAAGGIPAKPVTVAPLGVEPVFLEREGGLSRFARPTFLVCGTVESRKNHLLLLQLWRELAARHGPATPRLVIVGRRGWEVENVIDLLDRCPTLAAHVSEVRGLSTPGLARLMRAATALLMPSFVEGYGLPVVEAAASGLPVVASDIPVHREIGERFAHLLDPLDGRGWMEAVEALSLPDSALRRDLAVRLDGYVAPSWAAHFERFDAALDDLDARQGRGTGRVASEGSDEYGKPSASVAAREDRAGGAGSPSRSVMKIVDVDRDAIKQGLADGSILLIDVREDHEFASGHIPGSVSYPLSDFDPETLKVLIEGDGRRPVFSCASGVRSVHALAAAQRAGLDVSEHYEGAFKDWYGAGEPIER